jgi:hypothetical protein
MGAGSDGEPRVRGRERAADRATEGRGRARMRSGGRVGTVKGRAARADRRRGPTMPAPGEVAGPWSADRPPILAARDS